MISHLTHLIISLTTSDVFCLSPIHQTMQQQDTDTSLVLRADLLTTAVWRLLNTAQRDVLAGWLRGHASAPNMSWPA